MIRLPWAQEVWCSNLHALTISLNNLAACVIARASPQRLLGLGFRKNRATLIPEG